MAVQTIDFCDDNIASINSAQGWNESEKEATQVKLCMT
jgi:hypothetical protein